ncbi:maleylpyruvate isomerase N-terminal domain-containing protein [Nocardiopsis sp. LOL_012]|uniref:maleylpyruvate isomerase N-terminal domain-containing protein n=1 Tax=Nocardiopsis sp. LOL_012 TaxID=3345409 RepID=UPI003A8573BE
MNTLGEAGPQWRAHYALAARWYASVVGRCGGRWEEPALGAWSVRDLVGHTGRALSTVESYLGASGPVEVASAADYFRIALESDPEVVAERGRAAGAALGSDPAAGARELAGRVPGVVEAAGEGALVATPFGVMELAEYLPTRTFELVVHTGDVCAALGERADPPEGAARSVLALAGVLAGDRLGVVLGALTGRAALPAGFSVLGGQR